MTTGSDDSLRTKHEEMATQENLYLVPRGFVAMSAF